MPVGGPDCHPLEVTEAVARAGYAGDPRHVITYGVCTRITGPRGRARLQLPEQDLLARRQHAERCTRTQTHMHSSYPRCESLWQFDTEPLAWQRNIVTVDIPRITRV